MGTGGRELVAADEPAVMAKPQFDSIMVENRQRNGRLPNPPGANESDWMKVFNEMDYPLDQFIASKERPWWRRWQIPRYARFRCKIMCSIVA